MGFPSNKNVLLEPSANLVTVADFNVGRGSYGTAVNSVNSLPADLKKSA